jgi:hypothetical protein
MTKTIAAMGDAGMLIFGVLKITWTTILENRREIDGMVRKLVH